MNKEDVLKKARLRNKNDLDEREENIYMKSSQLSIFFMGVTCLILMLIKMEAQLPHNDVYSVFTTGMSITNLYSGWKLNKKLNIGLGIGWLFITVTLVYTYYQSILG